MGARVVASALAMIAGVLIWAVGASTASAASCAHPAAIGGKFTCLRVGAKCQTRNRKAYTAADLVCVRTRRRGRRLRPASLAAQRHGEVLALGPSGVPTYTQALWEFDQTIARLPGVHPPRGAVGREFDATPAIQDLIGFESRLTPAQRAVLNRVLNAPTTPIGSVDPTAPTSAAAAAVLSARQGAAAPGRVAASPANQAMLDEAVSRLQAHGVMFKHQIILDAHTANDAAGDLADTEAHWLRKDGDTCEVSFFPDGLGKDLATIRVTLVHELMHCATAELSPTRKYWTGLPRYFGEGLPDWASQRVGIEWQGSIGTEDEWDSYLENPERSLFTRDYDAAGWWALVEHEGVNLFGLLPQLVASASSGVRGPYEVAKQAAGGDTLVGDWGPTLAGHPDFGTRWDLNGPGEPKRDEPDKGTIDDGTPPAVDATFDGGGDEFKVDVEAEIVIVQGPKTGSGYFRDSAGTDHILTDDVQRFCTEDNGCVCPDGSALDYPTIPKGDAYIGFATDQGAGSAGIIGESADNDVACKGKGKAGIKVLGGGGAVVAVFSKGTCSLKGGTFTAHAADSGYTLDVTISGATYGRTYDLTFGGSNPTFTINGPGGPFTNRIAPPNPPPGGGGIMLGKNGKAMSLGFIDAFNSTRKDGVAVAGYMVCKSPKKR
jgi:hypothetical protein